MDDGREIFLGFAPPPSCVEGLRCIRHYESNEAAVKDGIERAKMNRGHLAIKGTEWEIEHERTSVNEVFGADER